MKNYIQNKYFNSIKIVFAIVALGSVVLMVSCEQKEIQEYRAPRDFDGVAITKSLQQPFATGESTIEPTASQVVWTLPDSWEQLDKEVSMRLATYMTPPGLEVTLAVFPGDVGGLLANVNRWRGQIGVTPIEESELAESVAQIDNTFSFVVDVVGDDVRLVGTLINVNDGNTWFAKTIGQPDLVEQIKADIISFSASFHIEKIGDDHAGHNHGPVETVETTTSDTPPTSSSTEWQQPKEWTIDQDASPILMAAYFADSGARITLTALGGGGGGMVDNINRWRDQLGLPHIQSMDDQPLKDLGNGAVTLDLVTEDGANRIVAGIVSAETQTLFFKLTGSVSETEPELERFDAFVLGIGIGIGRQGAQ